MPLNIYIMYNNEFIIMFFLKKEILKCIDAYAHFIILYIYLLLYIYHRHIYLFVKMCLTWPLGGSKRSV